MDAINRAFDELCDKLVWKERTLALLSSVDDCAWKEYPARVLRKLIELSFGQGVLWVHIRTQRELAERVGIAETHLRKAVEDLIDGRALQYYPELKRFEVLPDVDGWHTAARCCRGFKGAREMEADMVAADRRRREQIEMGEKETSFSPDTTIKQAVGQNSRQRAGFPLEPIFSAWTETTAQPVPSQPLAPSSGADAHESHAATHPSANTGAKEAGGARRLSDALRQSPAYSNSAVTGHEVIHNPPQKLTPSVSFGGDSAVQTAKKLTPDVSFSTETPPKLTPSVSFGSQKPGFSRAREKNTTTTTSGTSVSPSQRLTSDVVVTPDGRGGAGEEKMLVPVADDLFQEIYRFLGADGMGGFSTFWRAAIRCCRPAAFEALAETKLVIERERCDSRGGNMRFHFYKVCAERGISKFEHRELARGIPPKLAHHWRGRR